MTPNIGLPSDGVPNQGWKLYITSLTMIIFAGLFVFARIMSRLNYYRLGPDDYVIVASLGVSIFLSVAIQLAVVHGYGKHKSDLSKAQLTSALRWFFVAQTPYKIVVCLNKASVILLYLRIFVNHDFQRVGYATLVLIVAWSLASSLATFLQCLPIRASWDKTVPNSKCINSDMFWIAYAVLNVLTDLLVLALPVREVFRLKLKLREKIMLCGIFMLGGLVTAISVLRVTSVVSSVQNQKDITYNFIPRGIFTLIEANLGIICACLPILKQPIAYMLCGARPAAPNKGSGYEDYTSRTDSYKMNSMPWSLQQKEESARRSKLTTVAEEGSSVAAGSVVETQFHRPFPQAAQKRVESGEYRKAGPGVLSVNAFKDEVRR